MNVRAGGGSIISAALARFGETRITANPSAKTRQSDRERRGRGRTNMVQCQRNRRRLPMAIRPSRFLELRGGGGQASTGGANDRLRRRALLDPLAVFATPARCRRPPQPPMNTIPLTVVRTWVGILVLTVAVQAAESTPPPTVRAPTPGGVSGAPGRGPKGVRPDFWSGTLNNAAAFSDRGIPGFSHGVLVSRKMNFKGAGDTEVGYSVYLPPDYATSGRRYPVLYFLHGLGGNEATVVPVVQKAHELIAKGELPPFIIASAAAGRSFYGDQFEGKFQVHDFYIGEFIPHIDQTYRTKTEQRNRHIQGFSMGGYGALTYALKHLELFGAATDIGGALGGARANGWKEMFDANEEHYRPFDLFRLTEEKRDQLKNLRIAIWIGSEDLVRGSNVQYHQLLTEKSIGHRYNDWNNRPLLQGVGHALPRYYELHGKEILQFHTEQFSP
ncbi:MAG: hypothetical protein EXS37_14960 [Opitutus sp.]|nr:hypothetical protein [Opitutus sp.]